MRRKINFGALLERCKRKVKAPLRLGLMYQGEGFVLGYGEPPAHPHLYRIIGENRLGADLSLYWVRRVR